MDATALMMVSAAPSGITESKDMPTPAGAGDTSFQQVLDAATATPQPNKAVQVQDSAARNTNTQTTTAVAPAVETTSVSPREGEDRPDDGGRPAREGKDGPSKDNTTTDAAATAAAVPMLLISPVAVQMAQAAEVSLTFEPAALPATPTASAQTAGNPAVAGNAQSTTQAAVNATGQPVAQAAGQIPALAPSATQATTPQPETTAKNAATAATPETASVDSGAATPSEPAQADTAPQHTSVLSGATAERPQTTVSPEVPAAQAERSDGTKGNKAASPAADMTTPAETDTKDSRQTAAATARAAAQPAQAEAVPLRDDATTPAASGPALAQAATQTAQAETGQGGVTVQQALQQGDQPEPGTAKNSEDSPNGTAAAKQSADTPAPAISPGAAPQHAPQAGLAQEQTAGDPGQQMPSGHSKTASAEVVTAEIKGSDVPSREDAPAARLEDTSATTQPATAALQNAQPAQSTSGSEAVTQTAAGTARTSTQHAVDQVVKAVQDGASQGGPRNLSVRLDPPELGTLHVKVSIAGGELSAQVHAESAATHQMILAHQEDIRDALQQAGFRLNQIQVPDFQSSFSGFGSERGNPGQQWQGSQSGTYPHNAAGERSTGSAAASETTGRRDGRSIVDSFA